MIYKNPLLFLSFILIFIGITGLVSGFLNKNQYSSGYDVYADVIDKPANCENINYRTSFIKLMYNNKVFIKKIGANYCDDLSKTKLKVRISKDGEDLFFIDEKIDQNIGASLLIILIAAGIAIKAVINKKNEIDSIEKMLAERKLQRINRKKKKV